MNLRFDHLGLVTETNEQNQEIAEFFAKILGLEVSGDASQGYAEVNTGGMTIALHRSSLIDEVTPHGGTVLQFSSDDVRADIEEIRSRGGNVVKEPAEMDWGATSACVAGPHGVLVELYKFN